MKKNNETESGKWKLFRIVIVRIIVLTAVVIGYALPLPWRIIVPLVIGTVTILIETLTYFKRPSGIKEKKTNAEVKEKDGGKAVQKATSKENGKIKK